jgi:hypothetical protein
MSSLAVHDSFAVERTPEAVFAFIVDPGTLPTWQTIKTAVTPLTDEPTRIGSRFREVSQVGPRRWEQVVEVVEFEPARVFAVTVIDGPASRGRWTIEREGGGSRVLFEGEFAAPKVLAPVVRRFVARQFRRYHANLRRALELSHPVGLGELGVLAGEQLG